MSSSPRSYEAREGRRRRLAERGNDRMALITGQISSLPPPPPPPPAPSSAPLSPKLSIRRNLPPRHVRPESLPVAMAQEIQPDLRATQSFTLSGSFIHPFNNFIQKKKSLSHRSNCLTTITPHSYNTSCAHTFIY